ncbi:MULTISPECIES: ferritin [unclassified Cyanobium]|uniref:ferritin n=1 Tax=unclassified Cyanobium TaxID=2627006 RepID=UPI0020CCE840|nr:MULTISPECIES: ferritin [unclassified Cyanobium]MCP9835260.1 ferritin [Cyanobium sp. La Preciosa 7G6]MCP9938026.1 ferritin [Cyanobium sp. Aljojuca 7A6]
MTSSTSSQPKNAIATGPAGRPMAQPMDAGLLEGLQEHLGLERKASAAYWAMALWFAERELRGFATYLMQESRGEQHHAGLVADYLIARGQTVDLGDLPGPGQQWSDAEALLADAFRLEADVTASLQILYSMAERAADVRTTVFLDPLIQGQIAAENEAAHLLGRVRFGRLEAASMLLIDGELAAQQPAATLA